GGRARDRGGRRSAVGGHFAYATVSVGTRPLAQWILQVARIQVRFLDAGRNEEDPNSHRDKGADHDKKGVEKLAVLIHRLVRRLLGEWPRGPGSGRKYTGSRPEAKHWPHPP